VALAHDEAVGLCARVPSTHDLRHVLVLAQLALEAELGILLEHDPSGSGAGHNVRNVALLAGTGKHVPGSRIVVDFKGEELALAFGGHDNDTHRLAATRGSDAGAREGRDVGDRQ
jgi:hypothetical protein